MDDLIALIFKPVIFIFYWLFRIVFIIVIEVVHEYITWVVGWCFFRVLSFGKYPKQGVLNDDRASIVTSIIVSFTGVTIIALSLIVLLII